MMNKLLNLLILFIISNSILFAGEASISGTIKTAYFLDSKISGVHYQCNNSEILKTTGTDGSFTYDNTCSEIIFTLNNKVILGRIDVAKIPSDYKVYVTDLAGTSRTDTTNTYVKNLARLLQSLDSDENPKNGITINNTNTTLSAMISQFTSTSTLESIVQQKYPARALISEICAIVHLEEVLKDDGFYVDTVPPCKPRLALDINITSNDKSYVELIGERNSKIYLNGVNTNLTLDSDGRHYDFELNTPAKRGIKDPFNITFKDSTGKESDPLLLSILKDTDQPSFTIKDMNNTIKDNNITINSSTIDGNISKISTTDDSINSNIPVSYEVLGDDKDFFSPITTTEYANGILKFKSIPPSSRTYNIKIKIKDKANHYDERDFRIIVE